MDNRGSQEVTMNNFDKWVKGIIESVQLLYGDTNASRAFIKDFKKRSTAFEKLHQKKVTAFAKQYTDVQE